MAWRAARVCAASSAFLALSLAQRWEWCAPLVLSTTICYGLLFATLRRRSDAEWAERKLSSVNAVLLIVGSALCFAEWSKYEGDEGWISHGVAFWPVFFASLFVGYLQWDVVWMLLHSYGALDELLHHLIFISITHYVLWGRYFARPFAWLSMTELSTPFLNERWFLQAKGTRSGKAYDTYSLLFALTFLLTRVGGYGWGLYDLWRAYVQWQPAHWGLYVVIALLHVGYALNLLWASKVVGAARRAMKRDHSH